VKLRVFLAFGRKPPVTKGHFVTIQRGCKVSDTMRSHIIITFMWFLLSRDVLNETKFKRCNPGYDPAKQWRICRDGQAQPDDRLAKHKAGLRANKFVRLYGQRLLPELYEG
jgi:hypothetical protein